MLMADGRHVVTSRCEQDGFVDAARASRHDLLVYSRRVRDRVDHILHVGHRGALIWRHDACLR